MNDMPDAVPENGRATIRETYHLIAESRAESEAQLSRTEERLMAAIHASEARVVDAMGGLAARVAALELWRSEREMASAMSSAERVGRWWLPRMTMRWVEDHWKLLTVLAFIAAAIFAVVVDIDIRTK